MSIVSSFKVVSEPTCVTNISSTLIDLIFVSSVSFVQSCVTIQALGNADHHGLLLIFTHSVRKRTSIPINRKVWHWDRAVEILDNIDWDSLLPSEVNACWTAWRNYFMQISIPCAVTRVKKNPPWINQEILSAIRKRDISFRIAKSSGKSSDRAKYNRKRNQVVDMIRERKKTYFNNNLNSVDTKSFWKTVRILNNNDVSSIPTLSEGDRTADTNQAKAATLNNFFYTCFNHNQPPLSDSQSEFLYPSLSHDNCPSEFLCSEESVMNMLIELDTTKSNR